MAMGRPAQFETAEELQQEIDNYFEYIKGDFNYEGDPNDEKRDIKVYTRYPEPATITGLALYLGFESRQSFYDYQNRENFSYTIKRARLRIENNYEAMMITARNPAGAIFALKNLGWEDKHTLAGDKNQPLNLQVEIISSGPKPVNTEKDLDV
jgi:DNA-packaging protein gp3